MKMWLRLDVRWIPKYKTTTVATQLLKLTESREEKRVRLSGVFMLQQGKGPSGSSYICSRICLMARLAVRRHRWAKCSECLVKTRCHRVGLSSRACKLVCGVGSGWWRVVTCYHSVGCFTKQKALLPARHRRSSTAASTPPGPLVAVLIYCQATPLCDADSTPLGKSPGTDEMYNLYESGVL